MPNQTQNEHPRINRKKPPFHLMPNHIELSRKGGKARTKAKLTAIRLNSLKAAHTKPETRQKWLLKLCRDPETSALDIRQLLDTIKTDDLDTKTKLALTDRLINWHKAVHPTQLLMKTQNFHIHTFEETLQQWRTILNTKSPPSASASSNSGLSLTKKDSSETALVKTE